MPEDHYDEILSDFKERVNEPTFRFSIPIEIVFPGEEIEAKEEYYTSIAEICSARNNNIQLKETAKGNQVGCYDYLKDKLERYPIIWKTGEKGKIKAEDVIAMACVPLYFLQEKGLLPKGVKKFNRVNLYSSKGQCVTFFNDVISHNSISDLEHGKYIIKSPLIKSALDMTEDIMKLFDKLYLSFPDMYNSQQGSFGRITFVKNNVQSSPIFETTDEKVDYTYPDGYIYPLLGGIVSLMKYEEDLDIINWRTNPSAVDFDLMQIPLLKYVGWLRKDLDPQHNGKNQLMYMEAEEAYEGYIKRKK